MASPTPNAIPPQASPGQTPPPSPANMGPPQPGQPNQQIFYPQTSDSSGSSPYPPGQTSPAPAPPANSNVNNGNGSYGQENLNALQRAISSMEEDGKQDDPRYSHLKALATQMGPRPQPPTPMQQNYGGDTKGMLNPPQLQQLKVQIVAYRVLSRNERLPPNINMALLGKRDQPPHPPFQRPMQPQAAAMQHPMRPAGVTGGQPPIQAPVSGQAAPGGPQYRPPAPGQTLTQNNKQNRITPINKPKGIDPLVILQERENRIATRIMQRIEDLNNIPADLPDDVRVKAQTELRALRLVNFQRQLRAEVVSCTRRDTTLETAINIKLYKRAKRQGLRDARITEKLENNRN